MKDETVFEDQIFVKSHVARDLLQTAAMFKNEKMVVWEYVSNGLEYVDNGINPVVDVTLDSKKKRIVVVDNGRGMDWEGLKNFFVMHGENIDRKEGKPGRGFFGTGKSAAFGIAESLTVTSVHNGKRTKVRLTRSDVETMDSEDPIPVEIVDREIPTKEPNGTIVEIDGIYLKKSLDQTGVKKYIEGHLARWRNATVIVNNYECEYIEPAAGDIKVFHPEGKVKDQLGDVVLTIKIATAPLDEEFRGVSIYSNGVWHETTLAGNKGREMSQYIFGDIDVPKLAEDKSPIRPFDVSRSMSLNPENEIVRAINAFVGHAIDQVRRELVRKEKDRKAGEEAKKLQKQADEIARLINEDFSDFQLTLARVKAKRGKGYDDGPLAQGGSSPDQLSFGGELPAEIIAPNGDPGSEGGERTGGEEPRTLEPLVLPSSPEAKRQARPTGGKNGRAASRGGFQVDFKPMGAEESRALYVREERTIYVNLDHPQLVAAKGSSTLENPMFLRLAYEVAFSEYAIALAHELNRNNEYIDTSDPIVSIRETINRIARKAAELYSA
jgi:hypothetical protein